MQHVGLDFRDDDLLAKLPLPLAQLYRRALNAKSAQDRHHNAYYLAEAALKLAACLRIGIVLSSGLRPGSTLARSLENLCMPSVGHWVGFLRDTSLHLQGLPEKRLLPLASAHAELLRGSAYPSVGAFVERIARGVIAGTAALATGGPTGAARRNQDVLCFFERIAAYRNQVFGHGAQRLASFYEEVGPLLLKATCEVLSGNCLFGNCILAVARLAHDPAGRSSELEWHGLQGVASLTLPRSRLGEEPSGPAATPGEVYFVAPGVRIPLHPLIIYEEDQSERERVGFLNRVSVRRREASASESTEIRRIEYLDYGTGDHLRGADVRPALVALLGRLRGKPVGESDLDQISCGIQEESAEEAHADDFTGTTIGDFEIEGELGRGGMSVVYRARQRSLDRMVALKVLPPSIAADPISLSRFRREIAALARSDHPNLVKILTSGVDADRHYYAMELVEGTNLADLFGVLHHWRRNSGQPLMESHLPAAIHSSSELALKRNRHELPEVETIDPGPPPTLGEGRMLYLLLAELFADAADALSHLHLRGILHRDVKPSNLMVTSDGRRIVIMDLGLAQMCDRSQSLTRIGTRWVGTLRYAAPEQLQWNLVDLDERADIYGLGASFYEIVALTPLFDGDTEPRLIEQVLHHEPSPAAKVEPAVPRDLAAVIHTCLEKDRTRRYANARDLRDDLQRFVGGVPVRARPLTKPQRLWRWCRKNPALASASGLAVAALVGVAVVTSILAVKEREVARRFRNGLAQSYLVHGQGLCEKGDIDLGLHWMVRALGNALPDSRAMEEVIRANLAGWSRLWNPPIAVLRCKGSVHAVAFTQDASRILTGSFGNARLWSVETGDPLGQPIADGGVEAVAFSPAGSFFATIGMDGSARLWRADNLESCGPPLEHPQAVRSLAFSPDGKFLLTGGSDRTARLWFVDSRQPALEPLKHDGSVNVVAFSRDGEHILTASSDGTARLWRARNGESALPPLGHPARLSKASFSPDSTRILTVGDDKVVRIWSAETGKPSGTPLSHQKVVTAAVFSPDGKRILTASRDRTARLWSSETGEPLSPPFEDPSPLSVADFSPDGKLLAIGNEDGEVRLWTVEDSKPVGLTMRHRGAISALTFSQNGDLLATASLGFTAKVWHVGEGAYARRLNSASTVWAAAFDPVGDRVVTGGSDGTVDFWSTKTGEHLSSIRAHTTRTWGISISWDGRRLLTGSMDGTAKLWSAETGASLGITLQHGAPVREAIFSPDGSRIATACFDNTARIWSAQTGQPIGGPLQHRHYVEDVAFSRELIATGSGDGTAILWSAESLEPIRPPMQHQDWVFAVAFSPDGKRLATGSGDHTARIWSIATGEQIGLPLQHQGKVEDIEFSFDGKLLLTTCGDKRTRIWSLETRELIGPPLSIRGFFSPCGVFRPDGKQVLVCGDDPFLYDVPSPLAGRIEEVILWTQALTGLEMLEGGVFRMLEPQEWREARRTMGHEVSSRSGPVQGQ